MEILLFAAIIVIVYFFAKSKGISEGKKETKYSYQNEVKKGYKENSKRKTSKSRIVK